MYRRSSLPRMLSAALAAATLGAAPGPSAGAEPARPPKGPDAPAGPAARAIAEADLAPYFASGDLAAAARAFAEARYADAVAALDAAAARAPSPKGKDELGPPRAPARYLRALSLARYGGAGAGAAFATLAGEYPQLADRCHFHAAAADEDAGDDDAALRAYAAVPPGSLLWRDAVKGRARILRGRGEAALAVKVLIPLAALPPTSAGTDTAAEALYDLAQIHLADGDRVQAAAALTRLWSERPVSRLADLAGTRLRALGVPLSPETVVARGEALVEAHHNRRAIELLAPLTGRSLLPELSCRARFVLGKAYRKERLHTRALATLRPVVASCTDPGLRARARYTLASSASIVAPDDGVRDYQDLVAEFPEHAYADDALFFEADLLARQGRLDDARRVFLRLAKLYPDGDFRADALFKAFWIERVLGRTDDGLRHLVSLERDFADAPESYEVERARYWRGRTLFAAGRSDEAAGLFDSIAREHPGTYYGLLARSRLWEIAADLVPPVSPPADGALLPLSGGVLSSDPHLAAGIELLRLGFADAAADEFIAVDRGPALRAGDADAIRLLVVLLSRAGDARAAHAIARVELRGDLSGHPVDGKGPIWRLAYPRAYRSLVERSTKPRGIDPDLLTALMREESAFDPRALSWAGAAGLCQLLPSTALPAARKLGLGATMTRERLYDPSLNVELGAEVFAGLWRRFGRNPALAIAAYNAGGGAVDGWLRARGHLALDEFVEEIPIAETRTYVKRVLRTFNIYRILDGGPAPTIGQALLASAPGGG